MIRVLLVLLLMLLIGQMTAILLLFLLILLCLSRRFFNLLVHLLFRVLGFFLTRRIATNFLQDTRDILITNLLKRFDVSIILLVFRNSRVHLRPFQLLDVFFMLGLYW